jgi:hypothetical protein
MEVKLLNKRTRDHGRRGRRRRGLASLEVVMTTAVMLPIAAAILFLGIKMAAIVYQVIGALVAWPFL